MSPQDTADDWFRELLGALGPITVRRMFGGAGYYAEGVMIALEAYGVLYLKVDAESKPRFAAAGGQPFVYDGKGKTMEMSYWTVPDEAMDAPDAMRPWARLALDAALRGAAGKAAKAKKSPARGKTKAEAAARRRTPVLEPAVAKTSATRPAAKKTVSKAAAASKTTAGKKTSKPKPSKPKR